MLLLRAVQVYHMHILVAVSMMVLCMSLHETNTEFV